jgi:hypothetical protein
MFSLSILQVFVWSAIIQKMVIKQLWMAITLHPTPSSYILPEKCEKKSAQPQVV